MTTVGTVYEQLANANPKHGRLTYVSATQLAFKPFRGDILKLNKLMRTIPTAGIAGLANTGAFVNGVAAQSLAASTTYFVHAFDSAGVLTADFRTGANHIPSATAGNVGIEVYSADGTTPDDTRSLIGMVRTANTTPGQFVDALNSRSVISWFNRRDLPLCGDYTNLQLSWNNWAEVSSAARIYFCNWGDEGVHLSVCGQGQNSGSTYLRPSLGIDTFGGIGPGVPLDQLYLDRFGTNAYMSSGNVFAFSLSEGWHTASPIAYCNTGGIGYCYQFASGITRG